MDKCYKCKFYAEDYNYTDSWNFCSNEKSPNHYEAIDCIAECTSNHWELYKQYPLCSNCIHYEGVNSSVFGECWTCGKNNLQASDIEDNDWNWFEENKEPIKCEFYEYGKQLVNKILG